MRLNHLKYLQAAALVLLSCCHARAAIVADSVSEFSGTQGQNNWHYVYYSGSLDPSSFTLMGTYNPSGRPNTWVVDNVHFYTGLDSTGGHPNGVASTSDDALHFAVRRWIVESTGVFTVNGNIADLDLGFGDNGIIGQIYNGSTQLFSQTLAAGDFVGFNYSWTGTLVAGTTLDFVIDPNGDNDLFDSTRFTVYVETGASSIPEPSSLLLMVSGCTLAFRRNRKV